MEEATNFLAIEDEIVSVLKTIFDPEIPVNIYDMGLIYQVNVDEEKNVEIVMTLTAPNCPVADSLPYEVQERVKTIKGIQNVLVNITFDPPWNKEMMSDEAKLDLDMLW